MKATLRAVQDPGDVIRGFCEDCRLRGMTEKTIAGYKSCLHIFLNFLAGMGVGLRDVDNHVFRDFLGYLKLERKLKHKTVKGYFSVLSAFYDYLA